MSGTNPARRVMTLLAVAAISIAATTAYIIDRGRDRANSPNLTARLDHQQAQLEALESRLEALSGHLERIAGPTTPWRSPETGGAQQARIEQELEDPIVVEAARDRRFSRMDAAFAAERVDARWAPTTERRLEAIGMTDAILAIEPAPPTERRVECRARTCRMEFVFDNEGDATDWALAYVTGIGSNLAQVQYAVQRQPNGTARVLMFGAR